MAALLVVVPIPIGGEGTRVFIQHTRDISPRKTKISDLDTKSHWVTWEVAPIRFVTCGVLEGRLGLEFLCCVPHFTRNANPPCDINTTAIELNPYS